MTTVLNAYVMPAVDRYLGRVREGAAARGLPDEIAIVRSDAGVMSLAAALERPVNTVLSGPAGGVLGASAVAAAAGYANVVSMDMGGTSTDVCLTSAAEPRLTTDTWVSHYPIRVPIIDITTIGAGGGSIAAVSPRAHCGSAPRAPERSPVPPAMAAAANCPTVTDANLVLGRLPDELAGGELIKLDREAAVRAVEATSRGRSGYRCRSRGPGVIRIVDERMLGALRVVSVQRGLDPRELVLVPFGGAGPVHGAQLARLAGIDDARPVRPGVLSALGFLLADVEQVFTQTRVGLVGALDVRSYNRRSRAAGGRGRPSGWIAKGYRRVIALSTSPSTCATAGRRMNCRSESGHRLTPPPGKPPAAIPSSSIRGAMDTISHCRVEVVTFRVTAIGALPKPRIERRSLDRRGEDATSSTRAPAGLFRWERWKRLFLTGRCFDRGTCIAGPALIVQPDCTTVIHPGQSAQVDACSQPDRRDRRVAVICDAANGARACS